MKRRQPEGPPYPSRRGPVGDNDLVRVMGKAYAVAVYQSYLPREDDIIDRTTYNPTSKIPFSHSGLKLEIGNKFEQAVEQFKIIAGDLRGEQRVREAVKFVQMHINREPSIADRFVDNAIVNSLERSMRRHTGGFLERTLATAFLLMLDGELPEDSVFVAKGRVWLANKAEKEMLEKEIANNGALQLLRGAGEPVAEREAASTIAEVERQNGFLSNRLRLYTEGIEAAWLELKLPGERTMIAEPESGRVAQSVEGEVWDGARRLNYGSLPITVLTPLQ